MGKMGVETAIPPSASVLYAKTPEAFVNRIASYYAGWQEYRVNGSLISESP